MNTLLLVDDDAELLELMKDYLIKQGFVVECCDDSRKVINILQNHPITLMVTDLMMPFINGLQLSTMVREFSTIPIIMLTGMDDDFEKVAALESTIDNYLVKPISLPILAAEISQLLSTATIFSNSNQSIISKDILLSKQFYKFDGYRLDINTQTLEHKDEKSELTSGEFNLLLTFLKHPRRTLSRTQLIEMTNNENEPFARSIDVLVSRLRKKMPTSPSLIKTAKNLGYLFNAKEVKFEEAS